MLMQGHLKNHIIKILFLKLPQIIMKTSFLYVLIQSFLLLHDTEVLITLRTSEL